jgi:hypothetical protein
VRGKNLSQVTVVIDMFMTPTNNVVDIEYIQLIAFGSNIDITLCPRCGGTMRVVADITNSDIIQKILDHIEAQPPPLSPATAIQS